MWNHVQQVHFIQMPKKSKQPPVNFETKEDPDSGGPAKKQTKIEDAFARNDIQSISSN